MQPRRGIGGAAGRQDRVGAQKAATIDEIQFAARGPGHHAFGQKADPRGLVALDIGISIDTAHIILGLAGRQFGQRAVEQVQRHRTFQHIGGHQPVLERRVRGDPLHQQTQNDEPALADPRQQDRAILTGLIQEGLESPRHVGIGKTASQQRILAVIHQRVQRGLAIARHEQRTGIAKGRRIIGQNGAFHGGIGTGLVQLGIPVRTA